VAREDPFFFFPSLISFLYPFLEIYDALSKNKIVLSFFYFKFDLYFFIYIFFVLGPYLELIFFLISSFDIKLVRNWASWFFYEVITVSWPWLRVWNINLNWHQSFFRFFSYTDFLFQFHLSTLDFWKLSFMIFFTFIYKRLSRSRHLGLWFDGLALVTRVYFWVVFLRINIFFILSFSIGSI